MWSHVKFELKSTLKIRGTALRLSSLISIKKYSSETVIAVKSSYYPSNLLMSVTLLLAH